MLPVGSHIMIQPHPFSKVDGLIVDRNAIVPGTVLGISPDIEVPFEKGVTIFYFLNKQIINQDGVFVHIDHCHLFKTN